MAHAIQFRNETGVRLLLGVQAVPGRQDLALELALAGEESFGISHRIR
jgi:hypothetical protein